MLWTGVWSLNLWRFKPVGAKLWSGELFKMLKTEAFLDPNSLLLSSQWTTMNKSVAYGLLYQVLPNCTTPTYFWHVLAIFSILLFYQLANRLTPCQRTKTCETFNDWQMWIWRIICENCLTGFITTNAIL